MTVAKTATSCTRVSPPVPSYLGGWWFNGVLPRKAPDMVLAGGMCSVLTAAVVGQNWGIQCYLGGVRGSQILVHVPSSSSRLHRKEK